MDEKGQDTVETLHEIYFNIALQGLPFTALRSQVEIEKLLGVNFTGLHENETACKTFTFAISEYLFEETVKKKLELVNFIVVLCDGSTDNSVTKQEVLYIIFVDPQTFKPTIKFLEVVMPSDGQHAPGLMHQDPIDWKMLLQPLSKNIHLHPFWKRWFFQDHMVPG